MKTVTSWIVRAIRGYRILGHTFHHILQNGLLPSTLSIPQSLECDHKNHLGRETVSFLLKFLQNCGYCQTANWLTVREKALLVKFNSLLMRVSGKTNGLQALLKKFYGRELSFGLAI